MREIIPKNKDEFRKICLKKLIASSQTKKLMNEKKVAKKLENLLKEVKYKHILFYLPLSHEINFKAFFRKIRSSCTILVPFMQGVSFKVVKYRLPLRKKKFSIYEPNDSLMKFNNIDIMIVPVIGVDGDFRRIGFGKGMYDRYFESLKKKPLVIFVQLNMCCTKVVVTKPYDIQADFYVTPEKIYQRGKNDRRRIYRRGSRRGRSRSWLSSS